MIIQHYEEVSKIITKLHKNKRYLENLESLQKYKNLLYIASEGSYAVNIPKEFSE